MWVTGYLGIKVGDSECSWESATQWNSRGRTPLKRIPEYFIPTGSDFKVHLCLRQLNNLLEKKTAVLHSTTRSQYSPVDFFVYWRLI